MISVNTNIPSMTAQRSLRYNQAQMNLSLERLSTGLRINRASDDPAGLIASENMRQEMVGLQTGISNATRASNLLSTAEGGMNEVSSLLTQLQGLMTQSANTGGLSQEERQANQLQADSILDTIDKISNSTQFSGKQLLDGSYNGQFLIGSKVTDMNSASIGIESMHSSALGDNAVGMLSSLRSGGAHALDGNSLVDAQKILTAATKQVSTTRGSVGAFIKYTLDSSINTMSVQLENITAAESAIRDTDFAEEASKLTRWQILTQAASTVLAQANQQPQLALTLLQGIRR